VQYLYHKEAGLSTLELNREQHNYIFKVRRHRADDKIYLRNLRDDILYSYEVESLNRRDSTLRLTSQREYIVSAKRDLHIGWCIIEPKSIYKVLPMLNEMGLSKITFIYCNRSQRSFTIDFDKLEKILINSSQQSGRSRLMEIDTKDSLEDFIEDNPDTYMVNFSDNILNSNIKIESVVIGCEGGFSDNEVKLFNKDNIIGFDTPLILKSESAISSIASRVLLF